MRAGVCWMIIAILPAIAAAQGMCALERIDVDHLEGAVNFQHDGESIRLADVMVSLSSLVGTGDPPIATSMTKGDGRFSLPNSAPGRYWLSFKHPALIGFSIEIRLRPRAHRRSAFLIAAIRNDATKPCGGGSVHLSPVVDDACRFIGYQNRNSVDSELKLRRIEGIAVDTLDPPAPAPATCIALFTESGRRLVAVVESDRRGAFNFGPIPAGRYRLVAEHPGRSVANAKLNLGTWSSRTFRRHRSLVVHPRAGSIDVK